MGLTVRPSLKPHSKQMPYGSRESRLNPSCAYLRKLLVFKRFDEERRDQ